MPKPLRRAISRHSGLAALPAAIALCLAAGAAQAQSLCEVYTVKQGDTLSDIARIAGVTGGYQLLFSANQDVVSTPNIIEIGARLRIPCADGSLPGEVVAEPAATDPAAEPAAAPAEQTAAASEAAGTEAPAAAPLPPIRFLTAGSYAPFTDESLPEQGLFTELVKRATESGDPTLGYRVVFVNDWGSHLTDLLPTGAFDMGFPWYLPDCSKVENLSPANAMRCTEYDASDPFFEAVVGYYTLKGSAFESITDPDALMGTRLCRPDGWFTFDLEARQLVEPNVTMLVPPTQIDCWQALLKNEVDVVTFDALPAEADLETLDIQDKVAELADLAELATIHVFTPKTNPNGRAYLDILNEGLAELRANGQWFAIVSKHLAAHEARLAAGSN